MALFKLTRSAAFMLLQQFCKKLGRLENFSVDLQSSFGIRKPKLQNLIDGCTTYITRFITSLTSPTFIRSISTYEHLISQPQLYSTQQTAGSLANHSGRHQFHNDVETQLNNQINDEFIAAYTYLSMACYFGRTEVALPGSQGFFMNMYEEELEHAVVLANYVLMRGGHVSLKPIAVEENQNWESILKAFSTAVTMEQNIKEVFCNVS